ncbi:MAG TPA: ester cyclase [Solirubrobacteraceae bacterium]|nr:ester cyclase [Solirubrobacteraceae bacterium]
MSEDVRKMVARFYDEINAGNLGVIDELIADDFVDREEFPGIPPDKEGTRQFFTTFRAAFPDMRMDAHDVLVDGDLVCVRSTMSGTHEGNFMGMPPSGKRFEVTGIDLIRVRDGQVTEHWGVMDAMKMMQQLGAIPEQAPG